VPADAPEPRNVTREVCALKKLLVWHALAIALLPQLLFFMVFWALCAIECTVGPWYVLFAKTPVTWLVIIVAGLVVYRQARVYDERHRKVVGVWLLTSPVWGWAVASFSFALIFPWFALPSLFLSVAGVIGGAIFLVRRKRRARMSRSNINEDTSLQNHAHSERSLRDYSYAITASRLSQEPSSSDQWKCPRCGHGNPGNRDMCWNCDKEKTFVA